MKIHPNDAARTGIPDGGKVSIGNEKGTVTLHAEIFDGVNQGVVIVESVWPNEAFEGGRGINVLTSADAGAPIGGAVFHDTAVWIKPLASGAASPSLD